MGVVISRMNPAVEKAITYEELQVRRYFSGGVQEFHL